MDDGRSEIAQLREKAERIRTELKSLNDQARGKRRELNRVLAYAREMERLAERAGLREKTSG